MILNTLLKMSKIIFIDPDLIKSKKDIDKISPYLDGAQIVLLTRRNFKESAFKLYDLGITNLIVDTINPDVESIKNYLDTKTEIVTFIKSTTETTRLTWDNLDEYNQKHFSIRYHQHPYIYTQFKIYCTFDVYDWMKTHKIILR